MSEMVAEGVSIEVLCLLIGVVATENNSKATSLGVPSAQKMVKHCLNKIGVDRSTVFPYWAHEIQASIFFAMPEWLQVKLLVTRGKVERAWNDDLIRKKT